MSICMGCGQSTMDQKRYREDINVRDKLILQYEKECDKLLRSMLKEPAKVEKAKKKYKLHDCQNVTDGILALRRYAVPGGWLYREMADSKALCFVADPDMEIEE